VRFGQEIAGVMELGMVNRGEHSEITTVLGDTVDSEVSGNMIDLCPVGALTSKPFRYSARPWELSRRKSVSPHDSTGANLIVQVKNNKVMRVLPLENNDVNECWLADRDRFSYEALNTPERLTLAHAEARRRVESRRLADRPRIRGARPRRDQASTTAPGPSARWCPRTAPSRNCSWPRSSFARWAARTSTTACATPNSPTRRRALAGHSIASLSTLQRVLVVGSNLRKDHPLFALRVRAAARSGAQVSVVHDRDNDWAMNIAAKSICPPANGCRRWPTSPP
jgi:NADH-quinone oxidoreductase subunit G